MGLSVLAMGYGLLVLVMGLSVLAMGYGLLVLVVGMFRQFSPLQTVHLLVDTSSRTGRPEDC